MTRRAISLRQLSFV